MCRPQADPQRRPVWSIAVNRRQRSCTRGRLRPHSADKVSPDRWALSPDESKHRTLRAKPSRASPPSRCLKKSGASVRLRIFAKTIGPWSNVATRQLGAEAERYGEL